MIKECPSAEIAAPSTTGSEWKVVSDGVSRHQNESGNKTKGHSKPKSNLQRSSGSGGGSLQPSVAAFFKATPAPNGKAMVEGGAKRRRRAASPPSHDSHHDSSVTPTTTTSPTSQDAPFGQPRATSDYRGRRVVADIFNSSAPPTPGLAAMEAKLLADISQGKFTSGGAAVLPKVSWEASTSSNSYSALDVEEDDEE